MAGRPSKYSVQLQKKICKLIAKGNYGQTAARVSGISHDCYYDWLNRGRRGQEPYTDFLNAVEQAIACRQARNVRVVQQAAEGRPWEKIKRVTMPDGSVQETIERGVDVSPNAAMFILGSTEPQLWGAFRRKFGRSSIDAASQPVGDLAPLEDARDPGPANLLADFAAMLADAASSSAAAQMESRLANLNANGKAPHTSGNGHNGNGNGHAAGNGNGSGSGG